MGLISMTRYNITCDECGEIYCDEDSDDAGNLIDCAIEDGWIKIGEEGKWHSAMFFCPECASKKQLNKTL